MADPRILKPNPKPRVALAVVSLVLGIVSVLFCIGILTGIPAIITGHVARRKVRMDPTGYRGARLGMAGLALGYLNLLQTILLVIALQPALGNAKSQMEYFQCANNLRQIGMAVQIYATLNEGVFPRTADQFGPHMGFSRFLICPADAGYRNRKIDSKDFSQTSYIFTLGGASAATPAEVITRCPFHNMTLTADGAVHRPDEPPQP